MYATTCLHEYWRDIACSRFSPKADMGSTVERNGRQSSSLELSSAQALLMRALMQTTPGKQNGKRQEVGDRFPSKDATLMPQKQHWLDPQRFTICATGICPFTESGFEPAIFDAQSRILLTCRPNIRPEGRKQQSWRSRHQAVEMPQR